MKTPGGPWQTLQEEDWPTPCLLCVTLSTPGSEECSFAPTTLPVAHTCFAALYGSLGNTHSFGKKEATYLDREASDIPWAVTFRILTPYAVSGLCISLA